MLFVIIVNWKMMSRIVTGAESCEPAPGARGRRGGRRRAERRGQQDERLVPQRHRRRWRRQRQRERPRPAAGSLLLHVVVVVVGPQRRPPPRRRRLSPGCQFIHFLLQLLLIRFWNELNSCFFFVIDKKRF